MTLTTAASLTRKVIFVLIFLLILGITGLIVSRIWFPTNNKTESQEVIPDTRFGILPELSLPINATSSASRSYQLNLGPNGLPDFGKIAKVYFTPKPTKILGNDKITDLAKKLNFNTDPQLLNNQYHFSEDIRRLTIDSDLGSFLYEKEATASSKSPIVDNNTKLGEDAKNFLSNLDILNEDFKNGPTKITPVTFNGNAIEYLTDSSNPLGAQISLWPQKIDNLPIINPNFKQSLFYMVITKSARDLDNYLTISYTYYPIDKTTFSIYPLKTATEAYAALQAGQGTILLPNDKQQVTLTSVYLAYFQSNIYSSYLQPIFVFEGENFVAIVPAVNSQYLTRREALLSTIRRQALLTQPK